MIEMFKILIVDDVMEKTTSLMESINKCNFSNVVIDYELEYKKACNLLKREYYDLVILDIQLPSVESENGMTVDGGVKILELLSEVDTMKKPMNIIGLTAHDEGYDEVESAFKKRLFQLVKYDRTSIAWKNQICEKIDYLIKAKENEIEEYQKYNDISVDCAIITAVPTEFDAVKKCNPNWEKIVIKDDPTSYYRGIIENGEKILTVVLAQQDQMGMVAASTLTTKLISQFNPKIVAMLGIAAGCEGEVELGDILVATESWDYGSGKIVEDKDKGGYVLKIDPHQVRVESVLKNYFQGNFEELLYSIRKNWNDGYGDKKSSDIMLRLGPVVSGAAVIQDSNLVKEYILPQSRKVIGLDMETYAVYYAASSVKINTPRFISLKAVCDFANKEKNDGFQKYGAYVSANFFFKVIFDLFVLTGR